MRECLRRDLAQARKAADMAGRTKIRWGDTVDDDEDGGVLPANSVKGPDSHGVKTITEYFKNDKGEAIKKTTRVKIVNVEKKTYKVSGGGD